MKVKFKRSKIKSDISDGIIVILITDFTYLISSENSEREGLNNLRSDLILASDSPPSSSLMISSYQDRDQDGLISYTEFCDRKTLSEKAFEVTITIITII